MRLSIPTLMCTVVKMSRNKKAKIDFATLVATSRTVLRCVQVLEKAADLECIVADTFKDGNNMHHILDRCDEEALELIVVARLGIQGLDCLRSAMQLVPEAFLDDRVTLITNIVNQDSGTNYNYSMYGNKKGTGEKYYSREQSYVEASDVMFVERHLHHLFASLK